MVTVDRGFISDLEKTLGRSDAVNNLLGNSSRPDVDKTAMEGGPIPVLQPPPQQRRSTPQPNMQAAVARPSSRTSRPTSRASTQHNTSGGSLEGGAVGKNRTPDKNKTAHVRPFHHDENQPRIGDVRGASANWRPLITGRPQTNVQVDLLEAQRTQLGRYTKSDGESEGAARNWSMANVDPASRTVEGTAARPSNAMEINKIAQISKMVPGMSGSEIRSGLEAVNWDTTVAIKNLKIDKLYRIGVATKPKCEKVLQSVSWDLEQAASKLLDSL